MGAGRLPKSCDCRLADEIVRGVLAPGSALDETELAERFKCFTHAGARSDPASWRRADWSNPRAHRGAVVARPMKSGLVGMFEAMGELEALCAGLAAERMQPAERSALEATHEKLARADPCRRPAKPS